jgi:ribonuclease E
MTSLPAHRIHGNMSKKMLIDATHPEETRVVVVDGNKVEEFDFESSAKRQISGNIYLAKVTRVEPSLQAAFVEYGGNRHGFLAFSEIHPDYYQIPLADREALLAAEEAAQAEDDEDERPSGRRSGRNDRRGDRPARAEADAQPVAETAAPTAEDVAADATETAPAAEAVAQVETGEPGEAANPTAEAAEDAKPAKAKAKPRTRRRGSKPAEPAAEADAAPAEAVPAADAAAENASQADAPAADGNAGSPDGGEDAPRGPSSIAESAGADQGESVSEAFAADDEDAESEAPTPEAEARSEGKRRRRRRRGGGENRAEAEGDAAPEAKAEAGPAPERVGERVSDRRRDRNADRDQDDEVESVGAGQPSDEMRPRRPQLRKYKIQEVIKVRQIMLVQVVKEERGNKGAALTTYLSLAGRYCVLMPNTARGGGISRKITSAEDRKKLKEIASEFEVPKGMGIIIRTAGSQRTRTEIKRDYEFLLRQWEEIRELTLKSVAPTLIYEEGSLIKRSIRDLYSKDISEILVEGDEGYREAKDYMRMLMPSHAKAVQQYRDAIPLFSRHQVESYLAAMFNPTVQLKSGGYIVIGVTEALVAIDVNSGRSTREGSIEDTALKTNLEAADEIARQLRLRDLAGLIVIDFIDMDERRNNAAVEKRMKDRLASDRARIQIGRISAFGLMEMSRQRLRPGMLEASTAPCPHCHGTGLTRSNDSLALSILREVEEEGVRRKAAEVRVVAPVTVANFIINQKREHLLAIEARYDMRVHVEGDPALISPDHKVERLKTANRPDPVAPAAVRAETTFAALDDPREDADEDETDAVSEAAAPKPAAADAAGDDSADSRNRRRRGKRGGRKRRRDEDERNGDTRADGPSSMAVLEADGDDPRDETPAAMPEAARAIEAAVTAETPETAPAAEAPALEAAPSEAEAATKPKRRRTRKTAAEAAPEVEPAPGATAAGAETVQPAAADAESADAGAVEAAADATPEAQPAVAQPVAEEPVAAQPAVAQPAAAQPAPEPQAEEENRPKRRGWWNLGAR